MIYASSNEMISYYYEISFTCLPVLIQILVTLMNNSTGFDTHISFTNQFFLFNCEKNHVILPK